MEGKLQLTGFFLLQVCCIFITATGTIHQLLSNGDFETDKLLVHENGGTLLNYVPSKWSSGFGVSLISSKLFPKYKQGNGDDEIFLAMETASGFISEQLVSKKGDLLTLKFSSYSYCITTECAINGLAIYAGSTPYSRANNEMITDTLVVYDSLNTEKDQWVQHTIQFTSPADTFYLSINAFTEGHRSSGVILDDVACYSDSNTYSVTPQTSHLATTTTAAAASTAPASVAETQSTDATQISTAATAAGQTTQSQAVAPVQSTSTSAVAPALTSSLSPAVLVTSPLKSSKPEPTTKQDDSSSKEAQVKQDPTPPKDAPAPLKVKPGPPICIVPIQLLDKWGDGWDEAAVAATDVSKVIGSSGHELTDSGVARLWPVLLEDKGKYVTDATILLNNDGNVSTLKIVSLTSSRTPAELWEVLWSVSIGGSLYFGSYKTIMTLQCVNKTAAVKSILNGVTHTPCALCPRVEKPLGLSAPFVPPSPAKAPPAPPQPAGRRLLGGPAKPAPLTALTFRIENSFGRGWYNSSVEATEYFISDASRTSLVTSGTLCGPRVRDQCQEKLPDGDYVFRVTGNLDDFDDEQSWEFCGVEGVAQQELSFQISKGRCLPKNLTSAILPKQPKPKPAPKGNSVEDSISGYTKLSSNHTGEVVYAVSQTTSTFSVDSSSSPSLKFDDGEQYKVTEQEESTSSQQSATALSASIEAHYRLLAAEVTLIDCILGVGLILLAVMMFLTVRRRQQHYCSSASSGRGNRGTGSEPSRSRTTAASPARDSDGKRVSFRLVPGGADPAPMAPPHTGKYPRVKRAAIDEDLMDLSSNSNTELIPDLSL